MQSIIISPSDVSAPEVLQLFSELDDFFLDFLGDDREYYHRYCREGENICGVWVAYIDGVAWTAGCAAYREKPDGVGELKRMYVKKEYRGRGISKLLLAAVEDHAKRRGDRALCLSTRITLEPAVTLYRKHGFAETFRSGLYVEMEKNITEDDKSHEP